LLLAPATSGFSQGSSNQLGGWYEVAIGYLVPLEALILVVWWFAQNIEQNPVNWLNHFSTGSVGTCLAQWASL
jgi:hypothetical protein